jgi:hypothetical protein
MRCQISSLTEDLNSFQFISRGLGEMAISFWCSVEWVEFAIDGGDEDDVERLMVGFVGLAKRISLGRDKRDCRRALRISGDKSLWKM